MLDEREEAAGGHGDGDEDEEDGLGAEEDGRDLSVGSERFVSS